MNGELSAIDISTRRFMAKGKGTSKGFVGGGKNSGFVATPIATTGKKTFKGGK